MSARLSRRSFLGGTGGLTLWLAGARRSRGAGPAAPGSGIDSLRSLVRDPPPGAKPMTRWWWFGGAVTPGEITRELTLMKEAGLRGAEIQPVYPVAVDDPARGIRHLSYFSEEFMAAVRHAVGEARRLSLQLDFTLGSGWPYGGPFITPSLAARRLRLLVRDAAGPGDVGWDLTPQLTGDDRVVAVVAAPLLARAELDLSRARVLTDQPRDEVAQGLRRGSVVRTRVDEGLWQVMVFLDSPTGQLVKRPTVGMEGFVLDHHSTEAMALFLRAAGDRVMDALGTEGGPPFHSVFCDSLEVYGADWTADFMEEFERRRGYDLAPWLAALWQDAGEATPHVRHDTHLTLSELNLERFFAPLVAWAEGRGMRARIQAHGAPCDVMRAYGLAHVPEGENIFGGDRYVVNLRHRRLASSAAHLYGRPLASSETYTWLRMPLWMTPLSAMKPASDAVFLDGLNHIVNHGYSYSPPFAGEPGWAFYASTEANHTSPWWRHYPHLARYVQRASAVLQQGVAVNPVAVYLPLGDLFARFGAGGLHVDVEAEGLMDARLFSGLRHGGYDFDLVHDHALAELARVEGGQLCAGTARYTAVLVPEAAYMPAPSLERLVELARAGGHVIFVGRLPGGPAGLEDREERKRRFAEALAGLGEGPPGPGETRTLSPGGGSVALVADAEAALGRLGEVLPPDFRIVEPGPADPEGRTSATLNVGFVHRRVGANDVYFVANLSESFQELYVRFAAGHRTPVRLDLETGEEPGPLAHAFVEDGGARATEVELHLEPLESCLVVFAEAAAPPLVGRTRGPAPLVLRRAGPGSRLEADVRANGEYVVSGGAGEPRRVRVDDLPPAVELEGPWALSLGEGGRHSLAALVPWAEVPGGRTFSGWGRYATSFELPPPLAGIEWTLDLGIVHETAEVLLNGRALGAAWKGRRALRCTEALRPGRNELVVDVANLWIHDVASRPSRDLRAVEETFGIRWGRYGEVPPEQFPPSGLLGPVRLLASRRVAFA